jgi:cytochrome b6-f complex iron-sulfur subunit
VPDPGDPPLFVAHGRFLLVNLAPGEGAEGYRGPGGLLAIRQRCTHLHCEVEWRESDPFNERPEDRLVCPCHGGVFTKAGVRLFGPPPRSLDTLALRVTSLGDVVVDTSVIREGAMSNPLRAVVWTSA